MRYKSKTEMPCDNRTDHSRFKALLSFLRLGGIALNIKSKSNVNILYNAVCVVCYYGIVFCALMDTFVHRHDLVQAMKKIRVLSAMLLVAWMQFSLSYRKRNIERLLTLTDSFTWEELPTRDPDTGHLTKAAYIPIIQSFHKYFFGLGFIFQIIYSAISIVSSHNFIVTAWFPLDTSAKPVYVFANITQGIASFFGMCIEFGFPSLYATLVCVACSQLEKLRATLLSIRQADLVYNQACTDKTDKEKTDSDSYNPEELFYHTQKKLNECIRHHQEIKRFMALLEDTLNLPLCGLFLIFLSAMCLDAFSIITSLGDHTDTLQALVFYVVLTGSLFVFSWLGNELTIEAEMVSDAAWGCNWVGTPVQFQRCLIFIIATANKEFTLTAGKFVAVSNKTMMNMMNQSVSLFMFLLNVKNKYEDVSRQA